MTSAMRIWATIRTRSDRKSLALVVGCAVAALMASSCADRPLVVTPGARPPRACPLEGCDASRTAAIESAATPSACAVADDATCGGASAPECTAHALAAWGESSDDRALSCIARMFSEACELGDPQGCTYAGRLALEGRGVERDVRRGVGLLDRACVDGCLLACRVAVRFLADSEHARVIDDATELRARLDLQLDCLAGGRDACIEIGLNYSQGRQGYPRDLSRSASAYERGCILGERVACNNLGDACEYGDGVKRDLARAASLYDRACRSGEPLGCANLGHLVENGEGAARDVPHARALYHDACLAGSDYGCLHEQMSAAGSPSTPSEAQRALQRWQRACEGRDARACAFVGIVYEDGPDGLSRDEKKSLQAMTRGCALGERRACAWVASHGP